MGFLNRESLLKKQKLKIEKVDLGIDEETGEEIYVFVREMYTQDRDNFEKSIFLRVEEKGKTVIKQNIDNFRAKLAVITICDEKGELLFKPNEYNALAAAMGIARMEKIIEVSQKLNAITDKDKEELTKNSEAGQPGDSSSDLQSNSESDTLTN